MKTLHSCYDLSFDPVLYYEDEEGAERRFPEDHEILYVLEDLFTEHNIDGYKVHQRNI